MGLFSFVKEAGQAIFAGDDDEKVDREKKELADVLERRREKKLADMVRKVGVPVENFHVDLQDDTAVITGKTATQGDREKIVLMIGNTAGIARVDDRLSVDETVTAKTPPSAGKAPQQTTEVGTTFHTVERGDTLSGIAREYYGNASKYPVIFEANKPMLADPDKIYPGQVLRIPPVD